MREPVLSRALHTFSQRQSPGIQKTLNLERIPHFSGPPDQVQDFSKKTFDKSQSTNIVSFMHRLSARSPTAGLQILFQPEPATTKQLTTTTRRRQGGF
jgi:hypothetical protein